MADILDELKATRKTTKNAQLASLINRTISDIEKTRAMCLDQVEKRQDAQLRLNAYLNGHLRPLEEPSQRNPGHSSVFSRATHTIASYMRYHWKFFRYNR
jgi:hypothetical protein